MYHLAEDSSFYDKTQSEISYDELQALLKKDNTDLMGNEVALTDYLISIYIHTQRKAYRKITFPSFTMQCFPESHTVTLLEIGIT